MKLAGAPVSIPGIVWSVVRAPLSTRYRDLKELQKTRVATGAPNDVKPDDYAARLIKHIPAEVVAVYVFVEGVIRQASGPSPSSTLLWITFGVLTVLTPLYLWRVQKVTKWVQLLICTLSFALWVFSLGGPFSTLGWYLPIYGAVALPLFAFMIAIAEPET